MEINNCPTCKSPGDIVCTECNQVWYCSEAHKETANDEHKKTCRPFKVSDDSTMGRRLLATRDIKVGEIVLQEVPLIKGPAQMTAPVCLSCYKLLSAENNQPCQKCGWPMCSVFCTQSPDHEPECIYTIKKGNKVTINDFIFPHPNYQSIVVLRCLYQKQNNPELWGKIMKLKSHCEERKRTEKYENDRVMIAQFIRNFFKLEDTFSEEEIMKVCGIVQVNAHEIPLTEHSFIAIYEECSMLEHNCSANCCKSFTSNWEVLISASQSIKTGNPLTICYTDSLWGTQNRRHYLAQTKYFECNCERCCDKTEFGTYFSALKCQNNECPGYVLPETFLVDPNKDTDDPWMCNICNYKLTAATVQNILERVGQDLEAMQKGDTKSCQMFLEYYGKLLHYNHYYLTDVRLALSQLIGQETDEGLAVSTDEDLQLKLKACREIIELAKKLNPAENRVRGVELFELHTGLTEYSRRKTESGEMKADKLAELLIESKNILQESLDLLKFEPEEIPEGRIAIQAEMNLTELDNLLRSIMVEVGINPN